MIWSPTKRAAALAAICLGGLALPSCSTNVMTTGPTMSVYSQTLAYVHGSPVMVSITNSAFNSSTTVPDAEIMDPTGATFVGYWTVKKTGSPPAPVVVVNGSTLTIVYNTTTYKLPGGMEPLPGPASSGSILCIKTSTSVGCPAVGSGAITITSVTSPLPCPCP